MEGLQERGREYGLLQTEHACIICILELARGHVGVRTIARNGRGSGKVFNAGKHVFQAVNFDQLGRLTSKTANAEIATAGQEFAAEQNQARQGGSGRFETPAHVENDGLRAAVLGELGQTSRLHMGEALSGTKSCDIDCDHVCASYTKTNPLDCGSATAPVQTLGLHQFPCGATFNISSQVTPTSPNMGHKNFSFTIERARSG